MWNSYNILIFTILKHFKTVPMGTVWILWFFLVLRNFWVGTVKKPPCIYPSPGPKLIYCLHMVHKSVSEVLVPSTFQKYSIYISVPQKITLKKSLRQKCDDFFTEKGDFSSDSQKFVEILVNEKVIFQVICYKWWLFCRNSSHHFWWQFCHLLKWRFVHRKWWIF